MTTNDTAMLAPFTNEPTSAGLGGFVVSLSIQWWRNNWWRCESPAVPIAEIGIPGA